VPPRQTLEADLTWTGTRFDSGIQVEIDTAGRIDAVGRLGRSEVRRLRGRALLPGFVNAHSHAFQRGLRGRGERYPNGSGSFWTWRASMYELVGNLDRDGLYRLSRQAFEEMRAAGITAVGEFHYLHHPRGAADFSLDEAVVEAAAAADIRLVLIEVLYRTGGVRRALDPAQRRFASAGVEQFWHHVDRFGPALDPQRATLAVAAHSLRALGPDELVALHREAARRELPFHMHVEEQVGEIEEVRSAWGAEPMELVLDRLEVDGRFTAIHCTHTRREPLQRFTAAGGRVCLCPLTEASLGDGVPDLPALRQLGAVPCLGTDSNTRIAMTEEMRWLSYAQRLQYQRRGLLRDDDGTVARGLLAAATTAGAAALGLPAGKIATGHHADLVAVDLGHPSLSDCPAEILLPALVFGGRDEVVAETAVGGRWREHR
jgi:formimidoylglutamate deiminase